MVCKITLALLAMFGILSCKDSGFSQVTPLMVVMELEALTLGSHDYGVEGKRYDFEARLKLVNNSEDDIFIAYHQHKLNIAVFEPGGSKRLDVTEAIDFEHINSGNIRVLPKGTDLVLRTQSMPLRDLEAPLKAKVVIRLNPMSKNDLIALGDKKLVSLLETRTLPLESPLELKYSWSVRR